MRLSKTGLKVLKAQYRSVLLKCAAINAGIFMLTMPAMAAMSGGDITIDNADFTLNNTNYDEENYGGYYDRYDNISIKEGADLALNNFNLKSYDALLIEGGTITLINNSELGSGANHPENGRNPDSTFTITGGTINATDSAIGSHTDLDMSGGNLNLNNSTLFADKTLNISGGDVSFIDSNVHSKGINISEDANITLSGTDFTNDDLSKSFKMTDGTITMNGNGSVIGTNHGDGDEVTTGKFEMSGGNIIVNNAHNYIEGGDITVSGGKIDIAQGATLQTVKTVISDGEAPQTGEIAVIKLKDTGVINLSGNLVADITSDTNGLLSFNNSNAKINGSVEAVNVDFNKSIVLANAITDLSKKMGDVKTKASTLDIGEKTLNAKSIAFDKDSTLKTTVTTKLADDVYSIDTAKSGKIVVDNAITVADGAKLSIIANGATVKKGEVLDYALFNKATTGAFDIQKNTRFDITDNADGSFELKSIATAGEIVKESGGSQNNVGTATAWDNVDLTTKGTAGSVANTLAALSGSSNPADQKAYVQALTALAPEANGATTSTSVEGANAVFGAVGSRLSGGSVSGSKQGMSSGDSILDKGAMWVQTLYNKAKLDKTDGFDSDSTGIAFGAEKQINDTTKAGIGYAYSKTDIDSIGRTTDVDTHTAIAYGEYRPSNWYVNGIATYSWGAYEENKNVAGVGVNADYDVNSFGLQAMTGYDFNTNIATITPEAGVRYVNIKQKAYTDSANQHVGSKTDDVWTGVAGIKIAKDFELENGMILKPEARLALTYDMTQADSASVVTLANGANYTADASPLKRFGQEVGLGLTTEINDNVEIGLGYEGRFRTDYSDHTGLLNAKYKF